MFELVKQKYSRQLGLSAKKKGKSKSHSRSRRDGRRRFERKVNRQLSKEYDVRLKVCNTRYEVYAFHPKLWEDGIYVVRFHEIGQPFTDAYMPDAQVKASSKRQAISRAIKAIHGSLCH